MSGGNWRRACRRASTPYGANHFNKSASSDDVMCENTLREKVMMGCPTPLTFQSLGACENPAPHAFPATVCALRSDRGPAVVGLPVSLAVVERSWRSPFARAVPGWRWWRFWCLSGRRTVYDMEKTRWYFSDPKVCVLPRVDGCDRAALPLSSFHARRRPHHSRGVASGGVVVAGKRVRGERHTCVGAAASPRAPFGAESAGGGATPANGASLSSPAPASSA